MIASRAVERLFVWAGGALFVGSLTLTGWMCAVRFSEAQVWHGWRPAVVDALIVAAFASHHSLFAREATKRVLARVIPERLLRAVYVWTSSLLLIGVCLGWQSVGGLAYDLSGPSSWIFVAIQLLGVGLVARSVTAIHPLEFAGMRPFPAHPSLQQRGPYRAVRHPLYLGWLLVVFGAARMTGDRLTFAVLTAAYLVMAIPWEERGLERMFGETYQHYRHVVRWRIVPYVY